jgi:hypothetical protein
LKIKEVPYWWWISLWRKLNMQSVNLVCEYTYYLHFTFYDWYIFSVLLIAWRSERIKRLCCILNWSVLNVGITVYSLRYDS